MSSQSRESACEVSSAGTVSSSIDGSSNAEDNSTGATSSDSAFIASMFSAVDSISMGAPGSDSATSTGSSSGTAGWAKALVSTERGGSCASGSVASIGAAGGCSGVSSASLAASDPVDFDSSGGVSETKIQLKSRSSTPANETLNQSCPTSLVSAAA